jgi:type III secretion system YscJ/HrcJ family lipoprotein
MTGFLSACASETVIHGIDEREANQIIELLADHQLQANKLMNDSGRTVTYNIVVPASARVDAIRLLNRYEMPRRKDKGYTDVFAEGGLIPTSAEEKAKKLAALEGEIEKQLKLVDGVLDAQVQLVIPEESALRTSEEQKPQTTASVTLRYLPGAGGEKPLSEPQIQQLVAAGVENLTSDKVYPLLIPVMPSVAINEMAQTGAQLGNSWAAKLSKQNLNMLTGFFVLAFLAVTSLLVFSQLRLKTVRGKLTRLQAQIMKAQQRQGGESLPPPS